jgi:hypothetical protein
MVSLRAARLSICPIGKLGWCWLVVRAMTSTLGTMSDMRVTQVFTYRVLAKHILGERQDISRVTTHRHIVRARAVLVELGEVEA